MVTRALISGERYKDIVEGEPHASLIEFRHLRCFLAVAESLSFNRAAVQLDLSQQQVSQTVLSLEQIVKTLLLPWEFSPCRAEIQIAHRPSSGPPR